MKTKDGGRRVKMNTFLFRTFGLALGSYMVFWALQHAPLGDVRFWIAAVVELSLGVFTAAILSHRRVLGVALMIVPQAVLGILSANFAYLRPVPLIYWGAMGSTAVWLRATQLEKRTTPAPKAMKAIGFDFVSPKSLPAGMAEVNRYSFKMKGHSVVQLIHERDADGAVLWITESDGPIELRPRKNMQKMEKVIKGVSVQMESEPVLSARRTRSTQFIEARWRLRGTYFNIRSDMLSMDEVGATVTSMLP
jgi:hypothetical protein